MIVEYDCVHCGRLVRKKRSPATMRGRAPRFCSQQCNGANRRGTGSGAVSNHQFDCAACGKPCSVYRSPSAPAPRFCSVQCTGESQREERNPAYTGGRAKSSGGYVWVLSPGHPDADVRGYVYEHRLVMERTLGRRLRSEEVVHHRNRIKNDNRPENLRLLASQSDHMKLHHLEDRNAR